MIQIYETPSLLKKLYPSLIWNKEVTANELYLTFDDGPDPEVTPWVLENLDRYNAKATFFCVGDNIRKHENVAKEVLKRGHRIANHTEHHLKGWQVANELYFEDTLLCNNRIMELQQESEKLFRPPYGRIKRSQIKELQKNYQIIMWSHLSWDFDENLNVSKSIASLKKAEPGSIVVFHDSKKSFKNLNLLLPELLLHWSLKGVKFSTL